LFVGGFFTQAGNTRALHIARWNLNTQTWSNLSEGGIEGTINALAAIGDNVYIGGEFLAAGGISARNLARWNRTTQTWSSVAGGVDGIVSALAAHDTALYVGGEFDEAGSIAAANIARLDPTASTWSTLSTGTDDAVYALSVATEHLYVGGRFDIAGGLAARRVAVWDTQTLSWDRLGSGINGTVYALLADSTGTYVGGDFTVAGQSTVRAITRWDALGSAWSSLGDATADGTVFALQRLGDEIIAGGTIVVPISPYTSTQNAARWNTATGEWRAFSAITDIPFDYNTVNRPVEQIAIDGDDVYVVGGFTNAGVRGTRGIARWNSSTRQWSSVGGGLAGYATEVELDGDDLYVAGAFTSAGSVPARSVARWSISTQTWSSIPELDNYEINDLAISDEYVYYVTDNSVGRWSKTTQTVEDIGRRDDGNTIASIVLLDDDVYVGGAFGGFGGVEARYVARWNTQTRTWSALANGTDSPVTKLVAHAGAIYATGVYRASGVEVNGIAKWDPVAERWSKVQGAGGVRNDALAFEGNFLYVEQLLTFNEPMRDILRIDLTTGEQLLLGSGTNNDVLDIAVSDGVVYVGGWFTKAGDKPSLYFGRWQERYVLHLPLIRR
jgi:trimeric autotransporter adhesin